MFITLTHSHFTRMIKLMNEHAINSEYLDNEKLSVVEKVGYSLGDLAANLIFQTFVTFIAFFYTDVYKIPAEQATLIIFTGGMVGAFFSPCNGCNCRPNIDTLGPLQTLDFMDIYSFWFIHYFSLQHAGLWSRGKSPLRLHHVHRL